MNQKITVEVLLKAPIEKVWKYWTEPDAITKWCFASDDWCAPKAQNDLRVGGKFLTRMEAKDGSAGFDMEGVYTVVEEFKRIEYDFYGRHVSVQFIPEGECVRLIETFDPEDENSEEMQRAGWQAILDNFKKYVEVD